MANRDYYDLEEYRQERFLVSTITQVVTGMWAQRPAETLIHLPVVVQAAEGHSGWSGSAMADAGSEVDIISLKLAQHLGLKISPLSQAIIYYLDSRMTLIYSITEIIFMPKDSNGMIRTDTA